MSLDFSIQDDLMNMPRIVSDADAAAMGAGLETNPFGFTGYEFEPASQFLAEQKDALNCPSIPWNQVKADPTAANVLGFMGETGYHIAARHGSCIAFCSSILCVAHLSDR